MNRSLGANAICVVLHVDDVNRPICCARQASDITEYVSNLAPQVLSEEELNPPHLALVF